MPAPDALALIHAPAEQPVVLDRYQRRLVCPVLDQTTIDSAAAVGGDAVEQPRVVGPESRKQGHVVGATEDIHRVELEQAEPADGGCDRGQARLSASGPRAGGKALGGQRDAPRTRETDSREPASCADV